MSCWSSVICCLAGLEWPDRNPCRARLQRKERSILGSVFIYFLAGPFFFFMTSTERRCCVLPHGWAKSKSIDCQDSQCSIYLSVQEASFRKTTVVFPPFFSSKLLFFWGNKKNKKILNDVLKWYLLVPNIINIFPVCMQSGGKNCASADFPHILHQPDFLKCWLFINTSGQVLYINDKSALSDDSTGGSSVLSTNDSTGAWTTLFGLID